VVSALFEEELLAAFYRALSGGLRALGEGSLPGGAGVSSSGARACAASRGTGPHAAGAGVSAQLAIFAQGRSICIADGGNPFSIDGVYRDLDALWRAACVSFHTFARLCIRGWGAASIPTGACVGASLLYDLPIGYWRANARDLFGRGRVTAGMEGNAQCPGQQRREVRAQGRRAGTGRHGHRAQHVRQEHAGDVSGQFRRLSSILLGCPRISRSAGSDSVRTSRCVFCMSGR
jgi:hypothetical protein